MGIVTGERVRLTHDFVSATGQRLPASMDAAKRYEPAAWRAAIVAASDARLSDRAIARAARITHPTIAKIIANRA